MSRRLQQIMARSAAMHGLGDIPSDYGVPYAGQVMAPYTGDGPLGGMGADTPAGGIPDMLPAGVVNFWNGLPMAGKVAVAFGGYLLARKLLR